MNDIDLEALVATLPCWRGRPSIAPLPGGLSNAAFVVDDGHARYVARCGHDIPVHHVFRDDERAASIAAHEAGLSPELVYAQPGVMVLRYVEGRTLRECDLAINAERILALLSVCHSRMGSMVTGPAGMFWVFHVIRDYARTLRAASAAGEADLARYAGLADALEACQTPLPIVFGHHDLLPGNFIDDGSRLWLIDWEYGGFGTAMFDLANFASNAGLPADGERWLLEASFGTPVSEAIQRAFEAMKVASALREAMWGMVSAVHLAAPGADYEAHTDEYLARAEVALARYVERYGELALPWRR